MILQGLAASEDMNPYRIHGENDAATFPVFFTFVQTLRGIELLRRSFSVSFNM
jgi:hypothetical protein